MRKNESEKTTGIYKHDGVKESNKERRAYMPHIDERYGAAQFHPFEFSSFFFLHALAFLIIIIEMRKVKLLL